MTDKQFRTAFIAQHTSHDFSALSNICDKIVFVTNGYEGEDGIWETAMQVLSNFQPSSDLFVPVGNLLPNVIAGTILIERCRSTELSNYNVALYHDKRYHIHTINLVDILAKENEIGR